MTNDEGRRTKDEGRRKQLAKKIQKTKAKNHRPQTTYFNPQSAILHMFSLETSLFALLLFAGSVLLVRWHWVVWQTATREELDDPYRKFLHDQCRRRVQASGLIGLIGVAMFIGQFLNRWPLVNVFHWSGVLLLACWVILLAAADLLVTRNYLGRVRRDQLLDAMRDYAEIHRGDGEDASPDRDSRGRDPIGD